MLLVVLLLLLLPPVIMMIIMMIIIIITIIILVRGRCVGTLVTSSGMQRKPESKDSPACQCAGSYWDHWAFNCFSFSWGSKWAWASLVLRQVISHLYDLDDLGHGWPRELKVSNILGTQVFSTILGDAVREINSDGEAAVFFMKKSIKKNPMD